MVFIIIVFVILTASMLNAKNHKTDKEIKNHFSPLPCKLHQWSPMENGKGLICLRCRFKPGQGDKKDE